MAKVYYRVGGAARCLDPRATNPGVLTPGEEYTVIDIYYLDGEAITLVIAADGVREVRARYFEPVVASRAELACAQAAFDATAKDFTPLHWYARKRLKAQRDIVKSWLDAPERSDYPETAITRLTDFHLGLQGLLQKEDPES